MCVVECVVNKGSGGWDKRKFFVEYTPVAVKNFAVALSSFCFPL